MRALEAAHCNDLPDRRQIATRLCGKSAGQINLVDDLGDLAAACLRTEAPKLCLLRHSQTSIGMFLSEWDCKRGALGAFMGQTISNLGGD